MPITTCLFCKKEFKANASKLKIGKDKYCSLECYSMDNRTIRNCLYCGKEFSVIKSRTKDPYRGKYCSKKCFGSHRSIVYTGKRATHWKGGIVDNGHGYILSYVPNKNGSINKKYSMEHRLVMEQYLGRKLRKGEQVHHINGNKTDNRIENLKLMTMKKHSLFHIKDRKRDQFGRLI